MHFESIRIDAFIPCLRKTGVVLKGVFEIQISYVDKKILFQYSGQQGNTTVPGCDTSRGHDLQGQ